MRHLKQLSIILTITCVAEILKYYIPLPIPSSIYGLVIMFLLLVTRTIHIEAVKETANFLIEIMPAMFIPAAVGLLESWSVLRPVLLPVCVITVVTTVLVMGFTGRIAQCIIRKNRNGDKE